VSALGIFLYGVVVAALVLTALGLIAWGIVSERRDRLHPDHGREPFGSRAAEQVARRERDAR
jgi:hypothetical protein